METLIVVKDNLDAEKKIAKIDFSLKKLLKKIIVGDEQILDNREEKKIQKMVKNFTTIFKKTDEYGNCSVYFQSPQFISYIVTEHWGYGNNRIITEAVITCWTRKFYAKKYNSHILILEKSLREFIKDGGSLSYPELKISKSCNTVKVIDTEDLIKQSIEKKLEELAIKKIIEELKECKENAGNYSKTKKPFASGHYQSLRNDYVHDIRRWHNKEGPFFL